MTDYMLKADSYGNEVKIVNDAEFVFCTTNLLNNRRGFIPMLAHIGWSLREDKHKLVNDTARLTRTREGIINQISKFYPNDIINYDIEIRKDELSNPYLYIDIDNKSRGITSTTDYRNPTQVQVSYNLKDYNK